MCPSVLRGRLGGPMLIALTAITVGAAYAEKHRAGSGKVIQLAEVDQSAQIRPQEHLPGELDLLPRVRPGHAELHSAIWSGSPNLPAAHLANGADPNVKDAEGDPILFYALWNAKVEAVHDLLMAGADPNLPRKDGTTPLDYAVWNGHANLVAKLLEFGADPLLKSRNNTSALANARYYQKRDLIKLLEAEPGEVRKPQPKTPPTVLRRPDAKFGSSAWSIAGGGQAVTYSLDSRLLIVGGHRGAIRLLSAETGEVQRVLKGGDDEILGLVMIPNSQILVSAGYDGAVRFWDLKSYQEVKRIKAHHGQGKALAVSPDGKFLCTGTQLWEIESLDPLRLSAEGRELCHDIPLWSLFTPDSRYLVSRLNQNDVWVWPVAGGEEREVKGLGENMPAVLTWKDIAIVAEIGQVKPNDPLAVIVDPYTILSGPPELLQVWDRRARATVGNARAVACSPNGQYLASVGHGSRVYVYDIENRGPITYEGHTAGLQCIAASPDGKWIATGSDDCTVRIWDRATQKTAEVIETATFVYSVRFSPDSRLLAIGDNNGQLYLWDVKARTMQKYDVSGRLTDLAFDPKENFLAVVGWDLFLLDLETRQVRARITSGSTQQGRIALSSGLGLIVGTANSQAAGEEFKVPNAWSLDGNKLFVRTDLFSAKMGHRTFIQAVAFSPNDRFLAASSEAAIRLWDMKERRSVGDRWVGHVEWINQLTFSPDGKWLASASGDGTARVWEVATGQQKFALDADVYAVSGVDFTPRGDVVTANSDGTAHLWKLPLESR